MNPSQIRLKRVEKNISQEKIAKEIDVALSSFGSIERKIRPVKKDRAEKISKILKTPLAKLFKEDKKNKFIAI